MLATIFTPTGLYAFKRIGKLRKGILVYLAMFGLTVFATVILELSYSTLQSTELAVIGYIIIMAYSFIMPMVIIKKWTKQYNQSIQTQQQ